MSNNGQPLITGRGRLWDVWSEVVSLLTWQTSVNVGANSGHTHTHTHGCQLWTGLWEITECFYMSLIIYDFESQVSQVVIDSTYHGYGDRLSYWEMVISMFICSWYLQHLCLTCTACSNQLELTLVLKMLSLIKTPFLILNFVPTIHRRCVTRN